MYFSVHAEEVKLKSYCTAADWIEIFDINSLLFLSPYDPVQYAPERRANAAAMAAAEPMIATNRARSDHEPM